MLNTSTYKQIKVLFKIIKNIEIFNKHNLTVSFIIKCTYNIYIAVNINRANKSNLHHSHDNNVKLHFCLFHENEFEFF